MDVAPLQRECKMSPRGCTSLALAISLLLQAAAVLPVAADELDVVLPGEEQEAVYLVLEAINSDIDWRSLYPDDLCLSGPHGIVCDLISSDGEEGGEGEGEGAVAHVVELNFGYISEFSPNPPCGMHPVISPRLSGSSFPFLRKLFFYGCFKASSNEVSLPDGFWDLLPASSLEEVVFIENPSLSGRLSGKLGSFTRLRRLVFSGSRICGEIPREIGELRDLRELVLSRSRIHGRVPRSIGNCRNLQILDLSANQLEGLIPLETGQLHALLKVDLSENRISGAVPGALATLWQLEFLDLSQNNLTGGVPAAVAGMSELKELHLSGNPLGGTIPADIWENLGSLLGLGMSGVGLVGEIPPSMGNFLGDLTFLALDNNRLEGGVPEELRRMEKTAREINLENNVLSGRVPFSAEFVARIGRKLKLGGNKLLCLDRELQAAQQGRHGGLSGWMSSVAACEEGTELPRPASSPLPTGGGGGGRCNWGPPRKGRGGGASFFFFLLICFSSSLLHLTVAPPSASFL